MQNVCKKGNKCAGVRLCTMRDHNYKSDIVRKCSELQAEINKSIFLKNLFQNNFI